MGKTHLHHIEYRENISWGRLVHQKKLMEGMEHKLCLCDLCSAEEHGFLIGSKKNKNTVIYSWTFFFIIIKNKVVKYMLYAI